MAKGLRSSVKKHNKALLREKVFGPAADARTERLSAKLRELAGTSKADASMMDADTNNTGMYPSGNFSFKCVCLTTGSF